MTDTTLGEQDPGGGLFPNVSVEDEQSIAVNTSWLRDLGARTLEALGVSNDAALAVTLVDPETMAVLKEKALGERAPTDVLAFPMDDPADPMPGPLVVGDVVICPAVADEQARAAGHSVNDELAMLLVHGILHCLGRDHATPDQEKEMFAEQAEILRALSTGSLR
jgi:probable rRNA maturation factor